MVSGVSRWNIVLSDVPASDPIRALSANADSAATVDSRSAPDWAATKPPWRSASPSCPTSAADLFAPAARTSAIRVTSAPRSLKMFMACAAIVAASASSRFPAAARSSDPRNAPPRMSEVETPAFASSAVASAASDAENTVAFPASRAASRSRPISSADAPETARTLDIDLSNWANARTAIPAPASAAPPTRSIPRDTCSWLRFSPASPSAILR